MAFARLECLQWPTEVYAFRLPPDKSGVPPAFGDEHRLLVVGRSYHFNVHQPVSRRLRFLPKHMPKIIDRHLGSQLILRVDDDRDPSDRHFNDDFSRQGVRSPIFHASTERLAMGCC